MMIRHEAHMIGITDGVSGLGASAFGCLVLEDAAEKIVAVLAVSCRIEHGCARLIRPSGLLSRLGERYFAPVRRRLRSVVA